MKYDIITVYNCISEKTKFISETTEVIETLKKDLGTKERKVDVATIQYAILKSLIGLHEMVSYIDNIKTDRSQDNYLIHQIMTARILTTYLLSIHEIDDDTPYMVSKVIGEDVFKHLNPEVYDGMLMKHYDIMTNYSVMELVKFKPYIEASGTDIFTVVGPIIKLTPNDDVKYFKFVYEDVPGSVYISRNDKGINSLILVYNNTCAFFDTDKGKSVLEFSYDNMCYGKLMSHIINKVSNE
jgi:hypothetical protein|nr:MAG TPA: hypothetical protein [Caudoviricetes sp.]